MAFSPGGRLLASASQDGTIRVWAVATCRCLMILAGLPEGWVAFTPDGRYRLGGETAGAFWHSIGLCRFEPGELDPYLPQPLRVPDGEPLVQLGEVSSGTAQALRRSPDPRFRLLLWRPRKAESLNADELEGFRLFVLVIEAELDNLSDPLHERIE